MARLCHIFEHHAWNPAPIAIFFSSLLGQYVQSGQDADDPGIRTARIRSELEYLLNLPGLDIPRDSLDPFLDFLAEKIVAETQAPPGPGRETGPSR